MIETRDFANNHQKRLNSKYEEAIREETKNIKHWKREITKLKLEDIPGEEIQELKNYMDTEEGINDLEQLNTESKFFYG